MKHQACGFGLSLIIHSVVIVLAMVIGTPRASMATKPVVIDLSILESVISAPSHFNEEKNLASTKPPEPEKTKPVEKPKIVQRIRQLEKKAEVSSEPKMVTPVEKQGPVPIASDEVAQSWPKTEVLYGTSGQSVVGTGTGEGGGMSEYGAGGVSSDALRKKYLSEHFAYIKNIIQKNIIYPPIARRMGWQGKVIVDFIILENGIATDIKIVESSGYQILDNNIISTVKKVNPFPKPPVEARIKMPIMYRLTGF